MKIQTHKRVRKANFAENKVRVLLEEVALEFCQRKWHLNDPYVPCQQSGRIERRKVTARSKSMPVG